MGNEYIWRHKTKKKAALFEDINHAVFDRPCLLRCSNVPISGPKIQEEAKQIAERLHIDSYVQGVKRMIGEVETPLQHCESFVFRKRRWFKRIHR